MGRLANRGISGLPKKEAQLLQQINRGLPPATRARYEELNAKLRANRLTEEEHQELLGLVDQVELADAERLKHLIELAHVRGVSLDTLMQQLGMERPANA